MQSGSRSFENDNFFKSFSSKSSDMIKSIKISIADPEDILKQSFGEVKKNDSINYRTERPEKDGIACAKIFGPPKDYECLCGKFKKIKFRGIVCDRCNVEVTKSSVRRVRMGHIELGCPVVNPLFFKGAGAVLPVILKLTQKQLNKVIYTDDSLVVEDPGSTPLEKGQIITYKEYEEAKAQYGRSSFKTLFGAYAIECLLSNINLDTELENIKANMQKTKSEIKLRSLKKRYQVLYDFKNSDNKLTSIVMKRLPVMPADLRPLVKMENGRYVSSDLNDLYKAVVITSNRYKKLLDIPMATDSIIHNDCRYIQKRVDYLIVGPDKDEEKKFKKKPKSIMDNLKGKKGLFRQHILGKRVDYSARSVIATDDPHSKLYQVGLPKQIAKVIFEPFLVAQLITYGATRHIAEAKKMIDSSHPAIWDYLENVIQGHVVLLNRAPTLHRLGIQAFEPYLIEGKAIRLHPLVCKAFNADHDGDQMAVHLPFTVEAQIEARILMLSANNILSPQNGHPMIVPTKDMIAGLYYITTMKNEDKDPVAYLNEDDIDRALESKRVSVNSKIVYRFCYKESEDKNDANKYHRVETTVGRVFIFNCIKHDGKIKFDEFNMVINHKNIVGLVEKVFDEYGKSSTVDFCDKIKSIGFKYVTKSALSFGMSDMTIPKEKEAYVADAMKRVSEIQSQYDKGYITDRERYNKVTDIWSECTEMVVSKMMNQITLESKGSGFSDKKLNSLFVMMQSGARSSASTHGQLSGMRGLIAKPSGDLIETPIISNFKEGLTVSEYFNSAHGARKGSTDTALKTADAGYLTRRLADVAQDCFVCEVDCGSKKGVEYEKMEDGSYISVPLSESGYGRVLAEDVVDFNGDVLLKANTLITKQNRHLLDSKLVYSAKFRSPVCCESKNGICSMCYGTDLSVDKMVDVGEPVGIIAAQSIGEPGAQLTMRTFHIGGASSKDTEHSTVKAELDSIISFDNLSYVTNKKGDMLVTSNAGYIVFLDKSGKKISRHSVPYGSAIFFDDKSKVKSRDVVALWDPYNIYVVSKYKGEVSFVDFIPKVSYKEKFDDAMGVSSIIISDLTASNKKANPMIQILNSETKDVLPSDTGYGFARYCMPSKTVVMVSDGQNIEIGDIIAKVPRDSSGAKGDITSGLPKVESMFEARSPSNAAIIAESDGYFCFEDKTRSKCRYSIANPDDGSKTLYTIPKGHHVRINEGSFVKKGDIIIDGDFDSHDILRVEGIEKVTQYIVNSVKEVYELQGAKINTKHIEIIVKYMLTKCEVTDIGEAENIILSSRYSVSFIENKNEKLIANGKKPIQYKRVLLGITKAALHTDSFLSGASFQETARVLTDAAIKSKIDELKGMKESIIVGKHIPAGTGFIENAAREKAFGKKIDLEDMLYGKDRKSFEQKEA